MPPTLYSSGSGSESPETEFGCPTPIIMRWNSYQVPDGCGSVPTGPADDGDGDDESGGDNCPVGPST